jgi:hypothetical protein
MRAKSWMTGAVLGAITGVAMLVIGLPALLLLVPAGWWSLRDRARPMGLGGVLIGFGAGVAAMLWWADARCAASNASGPGFRSTCEAPDLSALLVLAGAILLAGAAVSLSAFVRTGARES